jgi:P-type E1-E2 ATPase
LVSFVNVLKPDAAAVVGRLKAEVGVDVKMITGDNIYTAVQTAFKSGILAQHQSIAICE